MTVTNLRSRDGYRDAAWDWGFLNECFAPTRIRIGDLDGIVERNGHFLVIEAKPATKAVSKGQSITFDALVKKGFTVLVLHGDRNVPVAMQIWGSTRVEADEATVQRFVRSWFTWASAQPTVREAA